MKLAVISDLHLAPSSANRCTASRGELLELFDELEARSDRVLAAGDLFDLDRPRRLGDWRGQLDAVRADFPHVVARLEDYEWIFGNHDGPLCRLGVPEEREYMADGLRVLARHGHQFDMLLKRLPAIAPTANYVAGWLHRGGLDELAGGMALVPMVLDRLWYTRSPKKAGPDRGLRGARQVLDREGFDLVICGHSHKLRLEPTPHGLFVNTGSICCGHVDWVLVDTAAGRVTAHRDGQVFQQATREPNGWHLEGAR